MASWSETSSLMSEHWSLGTAGFPYNYGITAATFTVTFTCAGLLEGTAFVWKQGQRVPYAWTLNNLKLFFVKIRRISDILCADNAVPAQKRHKSIHLTHSSAGDVWHIVYVMGTERNISSHGQREAAKLEHPNAALCCGLAPTPSPLSPPSLNLCGAYIPLCRASARAMASDIGCWLPASVRQEGNTQRTDWHMLTSMLLYLYYAQHQWIERK